MVGIPDFLTGIGHDQAPEFQELESPEGELHLRFYVSSGTEFALPATGIKEVLSPRPIASLQFQMFHPYFWVR